MTSSLEGEERVCQMMTKWWQGGEQKIWFMSRILDNLELIKHDFLWWRGGGGG